MMHLARILMIVIILLPITGAGSIQAAYSLTQSILAPEPDWTSEGVYTGVEYGISVSSAGDLNLDGYSDVVIGSQRYLIDGKRTGAAFIYLGGPRGLSDIPHRKISNNIPGSQFGGAVSAAGDVNGDGYPDIIIGASHFHETIGYDGAAYIYSGSKVGLLESPIWSKIGAVGDAQFGSSVSGAGDVNGDGYDDVLIGALSYSQVRDNQGAVFLYYGSSTGPSADPAWSFTVEQQEASIGFAVTGACDLNRDGFDDIAISTPYFDHGGEDTGIVWVFMGSASGLSAVPAWSASGDQEDARFGSAINCASDADGNGYLDLLVGALGYDGSFYVDAGAAYLFYNTAAGLPDTAGWMVQGDQEYSGFGVSVAGMGDANHDGYDDVAVGAHLYTGDHLAEGYVYHFRGGPSGLPMLGPYTSGGKADSAFGFSIATAGDVNADGFADLLVGAPIYKRDEKTVMGRAYLYNGVVGVDEEEGKTIYLPLIVSNP